MTSYRKIPETAAEALNPLFGYFEVLENHIKILETREDALTDQIAELEKEIKRLKKELSNYDTRLDQFDKRNSAPAYKTEDVKKPEPKKYKFDI